MGNDPVQTAEIAPYPADFFVFYIRYIISMMEKRTKTNTDMPKHNTLITGTSCLPLAGKAYLPAFTEVNPSSDS